jgi:hypothetical protein
MKHLDTHTILTDSQHGFRTKRSCETQHILTLEDILKTTSKGKQIDIYLTSVKLSIKFHVKAGRPILPGIEKNSLV